MISELFALMSCQDVWANVSVYWCLVDLYCCDVGGVVDFLLYSKEFVGIIGHVLCFAVVRARGCVGRSCCVEMVWLLVSFRSFHLRRRGQFGMRIMSSSCCGETVS